MRANQCTVALVAGICTVMISTAIFAQDPPWRHEIRRLDVPGAPDKQIVVELNEFKPGDGLDRHSHPGIEQGYVIQGAMVQQPGKDPIMFPTGTLLSNMPDVVHGGFKVVGDTSLKAFSVYVVDRNRPLYDWAK
jgi:quercetin dioxygenase-like cupin family protein